MLVLADRGGRPPQVQLAEPLEQLERFLAKRGQPVPWRSVVMLNHPRAKIISCADGLGAQVLTSAVSCSSLVRSADGDVGTGQVAEIGRLIERDHRFQAERRRSGTVTRESSVQELGDGGDELAGVVEPREVARARLDDEPGSWGTARRTRR